VIKGGYVLIVDLDEGQEILVGSLGRRYFPRGFYAYCGSALGSFKSRLNRHLNKNKKPRWHIDYLLNKAEIWGIILCQTETRLECLLAQALAQELACIPGFGCSDCHCKSHLFFSADKDSLVERVTTFIARLGLTPQSYPADSTLPEYVSRRA
jgi:Uri superfamily endonuclease